jgi:hypothetical protein
LFPVLLAPEPPALVEPRADETADKPLAPPPSVVAQPVKTSAQAMAM